MLVQCYDVIRNSPASIYCARRFHMIWMVQDKMQQPKTLLLTTPSIIVFAMIFKLYYTFFGLLSLSSIGQTHSSGDSHRHRRCSYGDPCWPCASDWASFNSSVSGRLIASLPPAAVCHEAHYNATLCSNITMEWADSFWRTAQVGAYSAILWEMGNDQCFINTTTSAPCDPGRGKYQAQSHVQQVNG
jgi:hypothetical protein